MVYAAISSSHKRSVVLCAGMTVLACLISMTPVWGQSRPAMSTDASKDVTLPVDRPEIAGRRIVKFFDFDERHLGNYDTLPMYWEKHSAEGFPTWLEGGFDEKVGHRSPPSFKLEINSGSIGYHYMGRDIAVRASSDYLVVAWVLTKELDSARAYMSASYLDRKGRPISGTEQFSEFVGETDGQNEWTPLIVGLSGNAQLARYIGISLWLTQARIWDKSPRPMRWIEREDVHAAAWFDDIAVYRLPRVLLRTTQPGNIFVGREVPTLTIELNDPDGLNLQAELVLSNADREVLDRRPVKIDAGSASTARQFAYEELDVGWYQADLRISTTDGDPLLHRRLTFVKVSELVSTPGDVGRRFGTILDDVSVELAEGQSQLLQHLHLEAVKMPVWRVQNAAGNEQDTSNGLDWYLERIAKTRADPIGLMLDDRPEGWAGLESTVRTMLDIFSDDPAGWRPLIAGTWSRYAGLIHVWQVGADGDRAFYEDDRIETVMGTLRQEMRKLMAAPFLASTASANVEPKPGKIADYESINIPATIPPEDIERHIKPFLKDGPERIWATIQPPSMEYPRMQRLSDLSRRLAETYFQNIGFLFMPACWDVQSRLLRAQVDPREDYIIFRTVADMLGATTPLAETTINGQARCLVFSRSGTSVLFVWDDEAPPEGYEHVLLLGEGAEQVDLWGRRKPLPWIGRKQVVRIGPVPTFITDASTWLLRFREELRLEPALIEFDDRSCERDVVFENTYHEPISGLVRLVAPPLWEVRPNRFPFALQPGEVLRQRVRVGFPINAEAGITAIVAEFDLDADQRYRITSPAWFELGLKDIDVEAAVYRLGDLVIVRQVLTNRTDGLINFEGQLVAPGHPRQVRRFLKVPPGQTIGKEFHLPDASGLAGQRVRVALKEMGQGSRCWNRVFVVP
jgi:hypothetical protein